MNVGEIKQMYYMFSRNVPLSINPEPASRLPLRFHVLLHENPVMLTLQPPMKDYLDNRDGRHRDHNPREEHSKIQTD